MASQGVMPDSKEGFCRAFVQLLWILACVGSGAVGMALRNGIKARDQRSSMANIVVSWSVGSIQSFDWKPKVYLRACALMAVE
jgi:ABC-type Fe3+-siderophore transport system permease subunit